MIFKLRTTRVSYNTEDKKKLELIGFNFEPNEKNGWWWLADKSVGILELSTMDELLEFIDRWGKVVVGKDTIEIYDDYRE